MQRPDAVGLLLSIACAACTTRSKLDAAPISANIGNGKRFNMIVEYIRYTVEGSRESLFLSAYEIASKSLRESPHCFGYELTRCTEAHESYILRILWDSEDGHLGGFRTSPQFKSFFAAVRPFVNDITEMRHYELTSLRWAR